MKICLFLILMPLFIVKISHEEDWFNCTYEVLNSTENELLSEYDNITVLPSNGTFNDSDEIDESKFLRPDPDGSEYHEAKPAEYPYHVAISRKDDGKLLCQGALFKPDWILTSGACMKKHRSFINTLRVTLGVTLLDGDNLVIRSPTKVFFYPSFNFENDIDDLALIKIDKPFEHVVPVELPEYEIPGDEECKYSTFDNGTLHGMSAYFVEPLKCDNKHLMEQDVTYYCAKFDKKDIETHNVETLGSPLVCDDRLYAIKSIGNLFSSISDESNWLDTVMNNTSS